MLEGIEIANMHRQTAEREERLAPEPSERAPTLETGLVAVVPGDGNRALFESQGATRVIEGGQTMNPSTAEIVAAIEATPANEVIVLPNNSNVRAHGGTGGAAGSKPVRVVPTTSVPAGLAAIVGFMASAPADQNEAAMLDAIGRSPQAR